MVGGAPLLCDLSLFHIFIILFFTIFILVNTVPATYCSLSLVKFYSKVSVVIESFWYRHSFLVQTFIRTVWLLKNSGLRMIQGSLVATKSL